jgi:hypothetical protein
MYDGLFPDWVAYLVVAILALVLLYWKLSTFIQFALKGKTTTGTIANWMMTKEGGKSYFHPIIEFHPEGSEIQRYRADERSEGKPMYEVGTSVEVRYLPNDLKTVRTIYPK